MGYTNQTIGQQSADTEDRDQQPRDDGVQHMLFILVDGVGIPPVDLTRSIYAGCPTLLKFFADYCKPVDATLGVPGLPQSATGQTAIFTGQNAARIKGAHISGFPDQELREIIRSCNFYLPVRDKGMQSVFSNAYVRWTEQNLPLTLQSVTTVAANSTLPRLLTKKDLLAGEAVYHDPTRAYLHKHGDDDIPLKTEEEAAADLVNISRNYNFTVYEFFLTDHAAHRGTEAEMQNVLASLDRFLGQLLREIDHQRELLVWTSDHGNIEEPLTRVHSRNPVPLCAYGKNAQQVLKNAAAITDIAPLITRLLHDSSS